MIQKEDLFRLEITEKIEHASIPHGFPKKANANANKVQVMLIKYISKLPLNRDIIRETDDTILLLLKDSVDTEAISFSFT